MPTLNGDIIKIAETQSVNSDVAMLQQANCFHIMGGGLAKVLKAKWPQVAQVDEQTNYGDYGKMGSCSFVAIKPRITVVNMYSQFYPNLSKPVDEPVSYNHNCATRYDAVYSCLNEVKETFHHDTILLVPYLFGAGLAAGNKNIIHAIFHEVLSDRLLYWIKYP